VSTNSKDLLAQIGLTQEELQDRVVNRIVGIVMYSHSADDEGREHVLESRFRQQIQDHATAAIDKAVTAIGDKFIVPAMKEFVETFTIQETNKWGDKIGQKLTFTEYLVKRAEEYAQEMVDSDGKAKGDARDSYHWRGSTTRISYLINSFLRSHIEDAMKTIIGDANKHLVGGLEKAVKASLAQISSRLKIDVKV
jgi:hypothetical protein